MYAYAEWTLRRREYDDRTFGKRLAEAIERVKRNTRPVDLEELRKHIDQYKIRKE